MSASQSDCEKFFRDLSRTISTDWQPIATHSGILSDQIDTINGSTSSEKEKSFQFLVLLRKKCPGLMEWSAILRKALQHEDKNDSVSMLDDFIQKGL